jgi:hypothetical protein
VRGFQCAEARIEKPSRQALPGFQICWTKRRGIDRPYVFYTAGTIQRLHRCWSEAMISLTIPVVISHPFRLFGSYSYTR